MEHVVYVLDKDGSPLMPMKRLGWVRRALRDSRAVKNHTVRSLHFCSTGMGCARIWTSTGRSPGCFRGLEDPSVPNLSSIRRPGSITGSAPKGGLRRLRRSSCGRICTLSKKQRISFRSRKSCLRLTAIPLWSWRRGISSLQEKYHIVPVSRGGSDTLSNLAAVCGDCHDRLHKDADAVEKLRERKAGHNKKYGALSVVNQITAFLADALEEMFPDAAYMTAGYDVKELCDSHSLEKSPVTDAYCLVCMALDHAANISEQEGGRGRSSGREGETVCCFPGGMV